MRDRSGQGAQQWHQGSGQGQREACMCLFLERREHGCERQRVSALNSASPTYKLCDVGQVDSVSEPASSSVKKRAIHISLTRCGD